MGREGLERAGKEEGRVKGRGGLSGVQWSVGEGKVGR